MDAGCLESWLLPLSLLEEEEEECVDYIAWRSEQSSEGSDWTLM